MFQVINTKQFSPLRVIGDIICRFCASAEDILLLHLNIGLPQCIEISIYLLTLLSHYIIVKVPSISILLGAQFLKSLSYQFPLDYLT